MIVEPRTLVYYQTAEGQVPFRQWQESRDTRVLAIIDYRLARLRRGLFGDVKSVGSGVFELRIDFGPGYRIYFSQQGRKVVLILCAGDKSSQRNDIERAKEYWLDHLRRQAS